MMIKLKKYRLEEGEKIKLGDIDPGEAAEFSGGKEGGKALLAGLTGRLNVLQERLYAAHAHSILVVLQGMDTCGKDGTIRKVFEGVNPQGVRVASFKVPTPAELDHDFLWRVHHQAPAQGEMVIFNRSHYEDVLVVRVHDLIPEERWQKRYDQINYFERLLVEEGTTILKFFLHISKDEQKKRLLKRLEKPEKNWKFNPGDLKDRELWEDYMEAYQDTLSKTSTSCAPWYIVPSNRKWFRDLVIASVLVETLEKLDLEPPTPFNKEELEKYRAALV